MTLFQKCLGFVIAILSVQVALFCAMSALELWSETQSDDIARSNAVVADCLSINAELDNCLSDLCLFGMTRDRRWFAVLGQNESRLDNALHHLVEATAASPDSVDARIVDERARYCFQKAAPELRTALANPHLEHLDFLLIRQRIMHELLPMITECRAGTQRIALRHEGYIPTMMHAARNQRQCIRAAIGCGFVISVLAAFASVKTFSRSVTGRLAILDDNFERLQTNQPLVPPLSGRDEISTLDLRFRDMSVSLREAMEKDRAITEHTPVALITCSTDGKIERINNPVRALLQSADSDILGRSFGEFIQDKEKFADIDATTWPEGRQMLRTGSSEIVPVGITRSSFVSTGQQKVLLALENLSAKEEVDRIKDEFMAIVSHDLRSPLTNVRLHLGIIECTQPNFVPEAARSLALADAEVDRLMKLTEDLLDVAKWDSGNITLSKRIIDPVVLLEAVAQSMEPAATKRGTRLVIEAGECFVDIDPDRITQVLTNLVSNAIKYSPANSVVRLVSRPANDRTHCLIEVIDQGPGIDEQFHESVFERFKQVSAADQKTGTGLGLAICKLFVEAHGGKVGVKSKPPDGSNFYLELPLTNLDDCQDPDCPCLTDEHGGPSDDE